MSDSGVIIDAYERILRDPAVMRLEKELGLTGKVRYELVGERRSFHGKAQMANGKHLVRLSGNDRPAPYLLLTLLHEWAHVLVYQAWERASTSPKKRGARAPKAVPARPLPHGKEWQGEYARLARVAVRAGIFPGNEAEVLRHADEGKAQTRHARLVGPDGQPLLPALERPDPRFQAGDAVRFADPQGRAITGKVRRVNVRTYTVVTDDGTRVYRVPFGYPSLIPAGEPAPPAPPGAPKWYPGMRIAFTGPSGRTLTAVVRRVNRLTLTVDADDGQQYRVGYGCPGLRPC